MLRWDVAGRVGGVASALLAALALGCGGTDQTGGGTAAPIEAAIVPDATFLLRIDVHGWNNAPFAATMRGTGPEPGFGSDPTFDGGRFTAITGLEPSDVLAVLMSADARAVSLSSGSDAAKAPCTLGVRVARPLALEVLERALRESVRLEKPLTFARRDLSGMPVLEVRWGESEWQAILVAATGGNRTYFVALSRESLAAALERAASGGIASAAPEAERLRATLSSGSQHELTALLPAAVRADLRKQQASRATTGKGVEPVLDVIGFAVGFELDDELRIVLVADLGQESSAGKIVRLAEGLAPMAQMTMAGATGKTPKEMGDRLHVSSEGSLVRVRLHVTADDAAAYWGTASKKVAALQRS